MGLFKRKTNQASHKTVSLCAKSNKVNIHSRACQFPPHDICLVSYMEYFHKNQTDLVHKRSTISEPLEVWKLPRVSYKLQQCRCRVPTGYTMLLGSSHDFQGQAHHQTIKLHRVLSKIRRIINITSYLLTQQIRQGLHPIVELEQ